MGERVLGSVGEPDLASSGSLSASLRPAVSTIEQASPASPSLPGETTARSRADDGILRQSLALPSPDHAYILVNWAMMERVIKGHAAIVFCFGLSGQFGRNRPNLVGRVQKSMI